MAFSNTLAEIRFGTGRSRNTSAPGDKGALLKSLLTADQMVVRHRTDRFMDRVAMTQEIRKLRRTRDESDDQKRAFRRAVRKGRETIGRDLGRIIARAAHTGSGFRERLVWFWADHFTIAAPNLERKLMILPYIDEAIRPHIAGRFEDMLLAVATHPAMITYLDQQISAGPNSVRAGRVENAGLNENLAREILELHTLGVGGRYDQTDVRNFAKLLTGMTVNREGELSYRQNFAEPGQQRVLGALYGGAAPDLDDIRAALRAIAAHPDTATHLARKLAVHFISDTPPDEIVAQMAAAYRDSAGELHHVYQRMLDHPSAWEPSLQKVRRPMEFIAASARAFGVAQSLQRMELTRLRQTVWTPLMRMGQKWLEAPGPDGWPEAAQAWITPQSLAARIEWAMSAPSAWMRQLPDPSAFLETALGDLASSELRFAAQGAETRADGIGLILASPEFHRR